MTKDELLERITRAVAGEETASKIYMEHISAIVLRSGASRDRIERIRAGVGELIAHNDEHKARLQALAERILQEPRDVY